MSGAERDLLNQVLGLLAELDRIMAPHRRRDGAGYSVELVPPPPLPPTALPGDGHGAALPPARGIEAWQSTRPPENLRPPPPPTPWVEPPLPDAAPDSVPKDGSARQPPDSRLPAERRGPTEAPPPGAAQPDLDGVGPGAPESDAAALATKPPRIDTRDADPSPPPRPAPPETPEAPPLPRPYTATPPDADHGLLPGGGAATPADPPLNTARPRPTPPVESPQRRFEIDGAANRTAATAAGQAAAAGRPRPPTAKSAPGSGPAAASSAPDGKPSAPADPHETETPQSEAFDEEPEYASTAASGGRRGRTLFFRGRRATVFSGEAARGLESRLRRLFLDRAIRRLT